jgi:hypothetical protein
MELSRRSASASQVFEQDRERGSEGIRDYAAGAGRIENSCKRLIVGTRQLGSNSSTDHAQGLARQIDTNVYALDVETGCGVLSRIMKIVPEAAAERSSEQLATVEAKSRATGYSCRAVRDKRVAVGATPQTGTGAADG